MKEKSHAAISLAILGSLVAGAVLGQFLFRCDPPAPAWVGETLQFIGSTLFIGLLKMVLVPLTASSVILGVASIGDPTRLGKVGGVTLFYFISTMVMAVVLGVALVSAIKPGEGLAADLRTKGEAAYAQQQAVKQRVEGASGTGLWGATKNIASQLIPANPLRSAADGDLLPVISFSLLFGAALTMIGPRARPLLDLMDATQLASMKVVEWALWLAPVGVFCLVAWTVARSGLGALVGPMGKYMATVAGGLVIHGTLTLPLVLWVFSRVNPYRFMLQMREPLMMAFSTSSSNATLPVSLEAARNTPGVSRKAAGFVLPLGATINMDGTALYEAVAVVFLFQCYGIPLGGTELAIVVVTATLAAIGAAGIPSAGLVTMVIVVEAVNNSLGLKGDARLPLAAVGIILGVDRILDMMRTTVNVWGDLVGARLVTPLAPDDAPRDESNNEPDASATDAA